MGYPMKGSLPYDTALCSKDAYQTPCVPTAFSCPPLTAFSHQGPATSQQMAAALYVASAEGLTLCTRMMLVSGNFGDGFHP